MRLSLLVLALLATAGARAQSTAPARGDVALIANVSGLTDLNPVLGGVGARYWTSDRAALGLSVGLSLENNRIEERDSARTAGADTRLGRSGGTVALWREQHLGAPGRAVSPFVGAGVRAGAARYTRSVEQAGCSPLPCPVQDEGITEVSGGVGAFVGAEVRVARRITLGAAYVVSVGLSRRRVTDEPFGVPTYRTETRVAGGTSLSGVTLSVYL